MYENYIQIANCDEEKMEVKETGKSRGGNESVVEREKSERGVGKREGKVEQKGGR